MEREVVGSRAFNIENELIYTYDEMRKDIVSYLSEYRLRVQKYDYELAFSFKEDDGFKVRDVHRGEAMSVKAKRSLAERKARGLPIHRELAEDAGIESLDEQLLTAKVGDAIFWLSPPGPTEEGYGNYGFLYAGEVTKVTAREKNIVMTAIRLEEPTISQCNAALSAVTGSNIVYISAEGFLANPTLGKNSLVDTDIILRNTFSFAFDEGEDRINRKVVLEMKQMIDDFVVVIKTGTREEKIQSFHALENYAVELKERHKTKRNPRNEQIVYLSDYKNYQYLADIVSMYGYRPPVVAGSCGPTGDETKSNDIFADNFKELMKAIFGDLKKFLGEDEDEWFKCPNCYYQATGPVGNICPGCHLTKESYAKNSGQPVCD